MKTFIAALFVAGTVFILDSCCGCGHRPVECPVYSEMDIYLSNFSATELDTVIFKKYKAGSNFSVLTDSSKLSPLVSPYQGSFYADLNFRCDTDTVWGAPPLVQSDVLLFLPSDSLTYKLSNFTFKGVECKQCGVSTLTYRMDSYYLNGVKHSMTASPGLNADRISIYK